MLLKSKFAVFFNKIALYWHNHVDDYVLGRQSIGPVLLLVIVIEVICFNAPDCMKILDISVLEAKSISLNLFTAYISTLGVVLAISAIVLAIIQISNNRLTTTKLVFTRTMFMPLVYFGLINIVYLGLLQLLHRHNDQVHYPEFYIQSIIASLYVFVFFIALTFIVFFKTFRYLNFNNIVDDYLKDVLRKIRFNYDNDYLSTRGSEVNAEIVKTIETEDNVMLAKLLQSINAASEINPNTTFLFSLNTRMAKWHNQAYSQKKDDVWFTLVSSWRELRVTVVTSGNENIKFYYSQLPTNVIRLIEKSKDGAAFNYALHLKELIIYSTLPGSNGRLFKASFKQVTYYLRDLVDLMNLLIDTSDIGALKKVYNQFTQILDDFDSRFRRLSNSADTENNNTDLEDIRAFLLKANNAALSIFSYYIYRVQFYSQSNLVYNAAIYDILTEIFHLRNHSFPLQQIAEALSNEAVDWRNWVWQLEDREDGKGYILDNEENIISFGLFHLYMRYAHLKPLSIDHYLNERFNWLRANQEALSRSMPELNLEALNQRILDFETVLKTLQQQDDKHRRQRIAASPRSEQKIEQFRALMRNQWGKSRNLYNIFNYYGAVEQNPEEKLLQVGTPRMNFKEGRMLFIDGDDYNPIHGIDWGKDVNREVERAFTRAVFAGSISLTNVNQISDALNMVINKVSKPEKKNLVAFIPSDKMYQWTVELINSGKYQQSEDLTIDYPFDVLGLYDNKILIVRLSKTHPEKQVIVISLPEAIHYQQRLSDDYVDGQLEVSVILTENTPPIADAEAGDADEIQEVDPANSIITVQEIMNFKVLNQSSILLFKIGTQN